MTSSASRLCADAPTAISTVGASARLCIGKLLTGLALALALPAASSAAPVSNEPLSAQDEIAVQVIFTYADSYFKPLPNGASIRFDSERSGVFEAKLHRYQAYAGVDSFQLGKSAAGGSISIGDSLVMQSGGAVVRRESGASAPIDSAMTVHIDSRRGVYSFSFDIAGRTTVTLEGPFMPPTVQENTAGLSYSSKDLRLPSEKDVIRGSVTYDPVLGSGDLGNNIVAEGRVMKHTDGQAPRPVHVRWQIGRPGPRPPLELILSVEGYDQWLPEGPVPSSPAGAPGNKATVVAKLRRKDGKALERGAASIRFTLPESSAEPGACLNFPVDPKPDSKDFDLRYVEGGDARPLGAGGQEAETAIGDWHEARALLGAFDWGAYGKITAVAYVPNYGEVLATIEGSTERLLRMPKRAPDSSIGDAWKSAHGLSAAADLDDLEKSDGNSHDGDGYTLYEEYRGVIARGKHSRREPDAELDPARKDLAVILAKKSRLAPYIVEGVPTVFSLKPIGDGHLASVIAGGRLLESAASRIHVVNMLENEAPRSREVNANHGYANSGKQHGVLVYDLAPPADGGKSDDVGVTCPLDVPDKTPAKADFVAIDFSSLARGYAGQSQANAAADVPMPYTEAQEVANTVAHELAHACGASHHGDKDPGTPTRELGPTQVSPVYTVIGVDNSEVVTRPFRIQGAIAGELSRSSGDQSCIMCYANYYTWRMTSARARGYTWRALLPGPMGTTLCTAPDSSPGNPTFGPAMNGRGNCRAKIHLKDY